MTESIEFYCSFMDEINHRYDMIEAAALGKFNPLPPQRANEFCYLQLRMISELIALGCLVAHAEIAETRTKSNSKIWKVDKILKTMERLHPDFYPIPSRQILDESGRVVMVEPIKDGFLTKKDLVSLYVECSRVLHRGTIGSITANAPKTPNFRRIQDWCAKIFTLLNHHQIQMFDTKIQYWVLMQVDGVQRARWFRMEEAGPL